MDKKAVDVVLLPDERMTEVAIGVNRQLVEKFGPEIVLDKQKCLPHISLAMGCIEDEDVCAIEAVLRTIAAENTVVDLRVSGIHSSTNSVGQTVSVFEVDKTKRLQVLHEEIMNGCEKYFSGGVSADMLYPSGEITESTLLWIADYRDKSSFEKFFPHITIGYGTIDSELSFPIEFKTSRLAMCHLGNHCTCRAVLVSVDI